MGISELHRKRKILNRLFKKATRVKLTLDFALVKSNVWCQWSNNDMREIALAVKKKKQ